MILVQKIIKLVGESMISVVEYIRLEEEDIIQAVVNMSLIEEI